jgi:MFS family permease
MLESSPLQSLQVLQRRTMRVLVVAQLLGALGLAAAVTAGALLAEDITGSQTSAGLPLSVLVLASGIGAVVVAHVMSRSGRRIGLAAAYLVGAAGASLVVAATAWQSWSLLLAGCGLFGGGNAAVNLARYAAADLASQHGRSISTVVTAGSIGAIAGPNLLGPTGTLAHTVGLPAPTGLFLLSIPAFLGAAVVLLVFLRPDPLHVARAAALTDEREGDDGPVAPAGTTATLAAALGDRHIRLALLVLAVVNLSMVSVMAAAPVHLRLHGLGIGTIGPMISAHIAAMYLPSPLTGRLSDALGSRIVATGGALVLIGAGGAAATAPSSSAAVMGALLLLGVGWNAGFIGGTALLRDAPVSPSLRTRAEGIGELCMGVTAAAGSSGAGLLLASGGFPLLGLAAAAPCLLILVAVTGRRHRARRRTDPTSDLW